MVAAPTPDLEDAKIYSHEEQLLLAEALLQDTSHEHLDSRPHAERGAGLVSRDFISSLSAEVDSLLHSSLPLNDVARGRVRPPNEIVQAELSPPGVVTASSSPRSPNQNQDWSIRRPETHPLGGTYSLFGPPPRSAKRSAQSTKNTLATYERNVEFVKQREARLENARKERDDQEMSQLLAPNITDGSRKLMSSSGCYSPPWDGKKSTTHSCRAQKVLKDAMEQKAQEAAEHTFKPHINQRSKEIFRHVINTGQPWHDRVHSGDRPGKPPGTKALTPEEQQHSFHPAISKKAQQLRREGHVSERLYRGESKAETEPLKKTRALQQRISRMLARECQAISNEEPVEAVKVKASETLHVAVPKTSTGLTPSVSTGTPSVEKGVSKLVEALSKRTDRTASPVAEGPVADGALDEAVEASKLVTQE